VRGTPSRDGFVDDFLTRYPAKVWSTTKILAHLHYRTGFRVPITVDPPVDGLKSDAELPRGKPQ
jgi:hypothetical protein